MAENVFIFGAGTSVHAGVPVMQNFFDEAYDLYDEKNLQPEDTKYFEKVIDAKRSLERISAKVELDLDNIEIFFSLVEMGRLIGNFPGCKNKQQVEELYTSFKKFIVRTIEKKTNFIYDPNRGLDSAREYLYFAENIIEPLQNKDSSSSCIITFNYDISMDHALELIYGNNGIDYCFDNKVRSQKYKLLKLHGSINWAKHKKDNIVKIIPASIRDFITNSGLLIKLERELRYKKSQPFLHNVHIEIGSKINNLRWMNNNRISTDNIEDSPVIVPPTWTKTEYREFLSNIWKQAAKEISGAKNIFIIGYSLPPTDEFFKYLLGLGMINIIRLKGFWVFNPDEKVIKNFSDFLRRTVGAKFHTIRSSFIEEEAIGAIKRTLRLK